MSDGFAASLAAAARKTNAKGSTPKQRRQPPPTPPTPRRQASSSSMKSTASSKFQPDVYILDDAYSWLPARITVPPIPSSSTVEVAISLPKNWHETTVLSPESTILDLEELTETSMYRMVKLSDYPRGELPVQNVDSRGQLLGKRDMADLPNLHEPAILYNIKERHYNHQPYTRVGDIVVAMNPFTWIDNLYTESTRNVYASTLVWEQTKKEGGEDDVVTTFGNMYDRLGYDPHVYETSCLAYRGLAVDRRNQTILVTGESGAGKTETVKIVMSHLATLEETRPGTTKKEENKQNKDIVTRVLESSPVFEAFGNAKTLRNDNSSRFGKFTQLQFEIEPPGDTTQDQRYVPVCSLAGSMCITYLLEKSRVVSHSPGERTYHIFYQLLAAPAVFKRKLWKYLDGTTLESFRYISMSMQHGSQSANTNADQTGSESDAELWPRTMDALEIFQFQGERLLTLLQALCVVLQLGNLTFEEDPASDVEEGGTVISSREELAKLEDIIGIQGEALEAAMTTRVLKTGYDVVNVQLRPSVSKEACDALAKEVYARIFDVLVRSINDYTKASSEKGECGTISLLDIFGFERFRVNRFEQLCINYANEQLQYKYVVDNFKQVQEEYESENIEIFDFAVVDNSDILNLLEGRLGLITSLNEECVRPKGNDESFVYKIKIVHKEHDRLIDRKLHRKTEFGVRHFAGPVTYDASRFVERNMDKLPEDLLMCASKSTNALIREEFEALISSAESTPNTPRRRKTTNRTVLEKFRRQLKGLMSIMEDTTTRYIRCIKPNDRMAPRLTDHLTTMRQLECAGLVTAIVISRESFPNRLVYESIRGRFDCLMTKQDRLYMAGKPQQEAVHYMLSNLLLSMVEEHANGSLTLPFACGRTKVYFRAGALEHLETKRLDYFTYRAVVIQKWIRRLQGQARFVEMRQAAIKIQRVGRRRIEYQRYRRKQKAAVFLQAWVRGRQATIRVHNIRRNQAATLLQSRYRAISKTTRLIRFKQAASIIQRAYRNKENRSNFSAKLAVAVEEARMDNKLLGLKEQVAQSVNTIKRVPQSKPRTINEDLLGEIESMFDYLRKEIFTLRGKNADLKAELRVAENDKRDIIAHAESAEAAASSSRLQVAQLTKSTQSLSSEIAEYKQELLSIRKELKAAESSRVEQTSAMKGDHERVVKERDREILSLQKTIKKGRLSCDQEKKALRDEIERMEGEHTREILHLKDELRRTQDSHHDYLAKLMDVLETTHAAREQETARISAELDTVKEEKDAQILALQREIEHQRHANKTDVGALQDVMKGKVTEVTVMRRDIEGGSVARSQRSTKFEEVSSRLVAAVSPDNLVAAVSARRSRGKKLSVIEEESMKMKKMVRVLGELYEIEENSQIRIDNEMLKMLDSYLVAAEPNRMLKKLQSQIGHLEAENKHLREDTNKTACKRCEARDRRRMERQRQNRQGHAHHPPEGSERPTSPTTRNNEEQLRGGGSFRANW